ncbi:flavin-containing monooxygenase [Kordiimonas sp.]|uniref:flavin-containing monooxygenase n=1 Tax=Kordiimonas sp. TaxID=1970157 RepID=UPI003A92EA27
MLKKNSQSKQKSQLNGSHVDVIIVGAGISGLGAAYELKKQSPQKSFFILESMDKYGGTWRCHKYPGVRSDSDLFTFGYRFKPWHGNPIASGQEILDYLGEVIDENDLTEQIHYNCHISNADWDSHANVWTVTATDKKTGQSLQVTCSFLWMCQGYYKHSEGYMPEWPEMDSFKGTIVHPQSWPEDMDYSDKKIVVIGSGATAATLVPALASNCEHVTMLQRSPTYFSPGPNKNDLADSLRELNIDPTWIHEIVRRRIAVDGRKYLQHTIDNPEKAKEELLRGLKKYLPQDVIDKHFTPKYRPWQQRIAVVPNADLFRCVADETASIVTDHIERFTPEGILLQSGKTLDADIIISATGFSLQVFGNIAFTVDNRKIDFSEVMTYRGMMFTEVPNMAWIMGYFRGASWTLRVDLVGDFVCRLLNHMDERSVKKVMVQLDPSDNMERLPWMDSELFNPGYMMRSQMHLPKRGSKPEWGHSQDYWWDRDEYPKINLEAAPFVYDDTRSSEHLARKKFG